MSVISLNGLNSEKEAEVRPSKGELFRFLLFFGLKVYMVWFRFLRKEC